MWIRIWILNTSWSAGWRFTYSLLRSWCIISILSRFGPISGVLVSTTLASDNIISPLHVILIHWVLQIVLTQDLSLITLSLASLKLLRSYSMIPSAGSTTGFQIILLIFIIIIVICIDVFWINIILEVTLIYQFFVSDLVRQKSCPVLFKYFFVIHACKDAIHSFSTFNFHSLSRVAVLFWEHFSHIFSVYATCL